MIKRKRNEGNLRLYTAAGLYQSTNKPSNKFITTKFSRKIELNSHLILY